MARWGGEPQPGWANTTSSFTDGDEEIAGVRLTPTQFNDTTADFGPVRVAPPPPTQFYNTTVDFEPVRVAPPPGGQFHTHPAVPVPDDNRNNNNTIYFPGNGGETPFAIAGGQKLAAAPDGPAPAPPMLVLTDAILRPTAVLTLVIALALLCTENNFQASPTTKSVIASTLRSHCYVSE
jgi:hypothetical protein